jgi:hypothetical protein
MADAVQEVDDRRDLGSIDRRRVDYQELPRSAPEGAVFHVERGSRRQDRAGEVRRRSEADQLGGEAPPR